MPGLLLNAASREINVRRSHFSSKLYFEVNSQSSLRHQKSYIALPDPVEQAVCSITKTRIGLLAFFCTKIHMTVLTDRNRAFFFFFLNPYSWQLSTNLYPKEHISCFALPLLLSFADIKLGSIHATKLFLVY